MLRLRLPTGTWLGVAAMFLPLGDASAAKAVAKFMLHSSAMVTRHQDASLSVPIGQGEPDMLGDKNVRLAKNGLLVGGGFQGSFLSDSTRLTIGATFFGVRDTGITYKALPTGYRLESGRLWGESVDMRLGREFQLGPLFPYIDLRLALGIMTVNTTLHETQQGQLGNIEYYRLFFGVGPTAGLFVPMGDTFFFDLSGYAGLFGDEKYGGFAGLGVWTRHL